ncbi:Replication-associated recombination protein RarA [hydrothermal vent metagenome]|uniref:Replication-associated recombination protein RarA n=1 Tax=hydrothermal vent metagenome TaxID=652676 RepID=A0A3B0W2X0_9ZZZZ
MDLFDKLENDAPSRPRLPLKSASLETAPLAERMRPGTLAEFTGQEHLLGKGRFLSNAAAAGGKLPSLILWGPPGCGKTTLAGIIARSADAEFIAFSAVLSGVKEIRAVVKKAEENLRLGKKTLLFVDEIHRFNKAQQDAFLHSVEDGTITLIGATTENPSFEVNAPLLSRCKVLTLKELDEDEIKNLLRKALADKERGLGKEDLTISDEAVAFIAGFSGGDAREALNTLEYSAMIAEASAGDGTKSITIETAREALQKKAIRYDKDGEEHYNVVSAFIKSMRGGSPDAALYWLARMLEAGEDPLFIARRMVVFASEDVGMADSQALALAVSVKDAVAFVGMPEGWINLAHGVTYLATAPKSNASYAAYKEAKKDVAETGALGVPMHLRNAPTRLMKELGYAKGYKYPHNYKDVSVTQDYLPEGLKGRRYYTPPKKKQKP